MKDHPLIIPDQFKHIQPEKKARILTSALVSLSHYGYHGASIKNIADYAGVSKALIYNYYSSKDELVQDLMKTGMEAFTHIYTEDSDPKTIEDASLFIDKTFDMMDEHVHFWKVYFALLMSSDVMHMVQPILMEEVIPKMYALSKSWEKFGIFHTEEEFMFLGAVMDGVGMNYLNNKEYFPRKFSIQKLKELYGFIKPQTL